MNKLCPSPPLFRHQKSAFEDLLATARVFFQGNWRRLPVVPRFNRFLTGPTGTGKTHLVRRLAGELFLPMLELSASSWIPLGCSNRGAQISWPQIAAFVRHHPRSVIFLDELDKVGGYTDWNNWLRVEIFSLLDRRLPDSISIPEDADDCEGSLQYHEAVELIGRRLRESVFLVAAGAFQPVWEQRSKSVSGFAPASGERDRLFESRDMAQMIPREIANRFASPVLALEPLAREDYVSMLAAASPHLPRALRQAFERHGHRTLDSAIVNQTGCRWVEEVLLLALLEQGVPKRLGRPRPGP